MDKSRQKFFDPQNGFKPCLKAFWSKRFFFEFLGIYFFPWVFEWIFLKNGSQKKVFFGQKSLKIAQNGQKGSKSWKIGFRFRSLTAMYWPSMGFLPIYQPFLASLAHFSSIFALVKCLWGSLRAFRDTFRCILPELAKIRFQIWEEMIMKMLILEKKVQDWAKNICNIGQ